MTLVNRKAVAVYCLMLVLPAVGEAGSGLSCQRLLAQQSTKRPPDGKPEQAGGQKKPTPPATPASEQQQKDRVRAELEREKKLREQALYLANAMLDYNDLNNKLEAASMKAEFAALVCACGERERAVDIVRKSLREAIVYVMQSHDDKGPRAGRLSPESVISQVAEAATRCDPASRKLIEADLSRIRPTPEQSNREEAETDPPVVPDELWGTKPSLRRSAGALLFVRPAFDEIKAGRPQQAENLLYQSLRYCVTTEFVAALTRIKGDPVGVQSLFLQAERQVTSVPSGAEMSDLNFGLPIIIGASGYAGGVAALLQKAGDLDPSIVRLIGGSLDATTALVSDSNASLVASSVDTIRMVIDELPLYPQLRPDQLQQVQSWVNQATQALSPTKREIALRVPGAERHPTDQIAAAQEIADKSDDDARKDEAYASMASTYIDSGKWDKAAETIANMSNGDLKTEMQDALSFSEIKSLIAKGTDHSEFAGRIDKVTSIRLRMKLYIQLGAAVLKKDPAYASSCLHQAEILSAKLDRSPAQSHLLLDIATVYADFDPIGAASALHEAVMSINHHDDQPPTRWAGQYASTTTVKFDPKFTLGSTVVDDLDEYNRKPYDLSAFRKMAGRDFDGGLLEASTIGNKSIMASAKYELCAAILLKKEPAKATPAKATPAKAGEAPPPQSSKPGGIR
jgi:hypothetical protein